MADESTIQALRAALEVTPDNVVLRQHLAQTLLGLGRAAETETLLRDGLRLSPGANDLKLLLIRAYRSQGKTSAAHVLIDDLVQNEQETGRALIERTRTLIHEGQIADAVKAYRRALDEDPEFEDEELSERLGVTPGASEELPWDPTAEVQEGLVRRHEGDPPGPHLEPVQSDVAFDSVGGMEEVKRDIRRKVILPLQNPELFESYGKKAGGGILLYGPPGCGKTHLARATAGEIDAAFLEVGIHDVLEMWIGQSERNMHQIFETARQNNPCVLFFDEADALGAARSDMRGAGRQTINQFLSELDGVKSQNDGILVLAATNAPWQMDSAFRRPGRFDRVVFVPPPDEAARAAILEIELRGKPQEEIDYKLLAKKTDGFSGADLKAIVDEAVESVIEQAMESGEVRPLTTKDLLKSRKKRKPTTGEWFRTVRNHVLYANDDGLFDDVRPWLKM